MNHKIPSLVDGLGPQWTNGKIHLPIFKFFDPELFLSKGNEGTKLKKKLKERPSREWPSLRSIPWAGPNPETIIDAMFVGTADRSLPRLFSERPYQQLTGIDAETYSQPLD
jgi:hypothetical protein